MNIIQQNNINRNKLHASQMNDNEITNEITNEAMNENIDIFLKQINNWENESKKFMKILTTYVTIFQEMHDQMEKIWLETSLPTYYELENGEWFSKMEIFESMSIIAYLLNIIETDVKYIRITIKIITKIIKRVKKFFKTRIRNDTNIKWNDKINEDIKQGMEYNVNIYYLANYYFKNIMSHLATKTEIIKYTICDIINDYYIMLNNNNKYFVINQIIIEEQYILSQIIARSHKMISTQISDSSNNIIWTNDQTKVICLSIARIWNRLFNNYYHNITITKSDYDLYTIFIANHIYEYE